jgi:carboxyl-terminal processing protease
LSIEYLDPSKRYFTQKDITDFAKYKYSIDNQLKKAKSAFLS